MKNIKTQDEKVGLERKMIKEVDQSDVTSIKNEIHRKKSKLEL